MNVNLQEYIPHILKYLMMKFVKKYLHARIESNLNLILEIFGEKIFRSVPVKN
jgi:hypothetical protein